MSNKISRRSFAKTAGAAAGLTIMAGRAPFSYAANEKVAVASIGTGGQGSFHVRDGLSRANNVEIVAVCDVYKPHLEGGWKNAGGTDRVRKFMDYREMLEKLDFDAAIITTPLHTHYDITMDCLNAGKHCFTEKTMCAEIDEAKEICELSLNKGLILQVGHQRRYNPTYNHAIKLAWEDNALGRITHIDAQWHRNNDWRRPVSRRPLSKEEKKYIKNLEKHINWRLYKDTSRGLMTELATHQLDIATWFLDSMPVRVYGMGGIDYWKDGREVGDTVNLVYEFKMNSNSQGHSTIAPRTKEQALYAYKNKTLTSDKQIDDEYSVYFCYSSICANSMKGCTELIQGDKGTFEMTELGSVIYQEPGAKSIFDQKGQRSEEENAMVITSGGTLGLSNKKVKDSTPIQVDTDKTVDQLQFEGMADCIMARENGDKTIFPQSNCMVGLRAAVNGLVGYKAVTEGILVDIDPSMYTLDKLDEGVVAPNPSMYKEA